MKSFGKILLLIAGSFFIGIFVTFGLQLLGDFINWGYAEMPRRIALFVFVGLLSWYASYLVNFYTDHKNHAKKPTGLFNFWKEI